MLQEYVTLGFSLLGLIVSITALYLGQFRKPKMTAMLGPELHLYHPSDGGSAIYLPMIFSNASPTRGVIYQIYLRILAPDGINYYLRWGREASITELTWEYSNVARVKPFTIDGYSSTSKVYWFLWPENESQPLQFGAGKYKFTTYIWSTRRRRPDVITKETLEIESEVATILADRYSQKDPRTRILYFKDKDLVASATTNSDANILWNQEQTRP